MTGLVPLHGMGTRQDLPLPFEYVVGGAIAALTLSFLVLALAWRRPRFDHLVGRPLPRLTQWVDRATPALRLAALAGVGWMALALLFGQDRVTNPVFGFVFVLLWVGLVPVSLALGPIARHLNPARTLAGWLPGRDDAAWLPRVGVWPAALAVTGFAWLELIQPDNNTLPVLRWWSLGWLVWTVGGALLAGRAWIGAADPFEALATLVASLSPWRRVDGIICMVNPLRNAVATPRPPGSAALACALLGATAFDSLGNTTWWIAFVQQGDLPPELVRTGGLLAMMGLVGISYLVAAGPRFADLLSCGLVPIVVGYQVAHYLSLLVVEGQRTLILASDPLGLGWNVFGTAELGVNLAIFDAPAMTAAIQLAAIVGGHLLGVVIAHDRALASERPSTWSQVPLLLLMVGYTTAGLVLLFSP